LTEQWVLNASPLIVLTKIGQERLILDQADEAIIPQSVADEIATGPENDPAKRFIFYEQSLPIIKTPPASIELLGWDLGKGETSVLSYAIDTPGWKAIIDDKAARKCALSFKIPFMGTIAIILLAKQRGLIESAADILRKLKSNGFYLDENLVREALRQTVGEEW
jgi:predicted nucleic acid-binding protein